MQARMATYSFSGDDAHALARRAEEGILPILKSQPGFKAYSVAIGDGEVLSLSVWDTRAEASTTLALCVCQAVAPANVLTPSVVLNMISP